MESLESIRDNFMHRMQSNIKSFADLLNHIDSSISCGTAEISTVTKLDSLINDYYRSVSDGDDISGVSFIDNGDINNSLERSPESEVEESEEDSEEESETKSRDDESEEDSESKSRNEESEVESCDYNNSDSDSDGELNFGTSYLYGLNHVSSNKSSKFSDFADNIIENNLNLSDIYPIYQKDSNFINNFKNFMELVSVY